MVALCCIGVLDFTIGCVTLVEVLMMVAKLYMSMAVNSKCSVRMPLATTFGLV